MMNKPLVQTLRWHEAERFARHIREQVFIDEQQVPIELEWDGKDQDAFHAIVMQHGKAVATARLLSDGHIGRMAVLKPFRNQGIGSNMLNSLITQAKKLGLKQVELSAQEHAIPFYEKQGFRVISESYIDAGIPHRDMVCEL